MLNNVKNFFTKDSLKESLRIMLPTFISIILAFTVAAVLLLLIGKNPVTAYGALLKGAFGASHRFSETLVRTTSYTIMALGTSIAFRCKIWNIGGDGQYAMGTIAAISVALYVPLPAFILFPLTFVVAFIFGGLWGGLASFLKIKFNASEVITTIMLNFIAMLFLAWIIRGPLMDPLGFGNPQTMILPEAFRLNILKSGTRLNAGIFIGMLSVAAVYFFWKTPFGFSVRLAGEGKEVAEYSGVNVNRTIMTTMLISAGFAGLTGWVEITGLHYRLIDDISVGIGTIAIVVALLGRLNPIGILFSAFFMSTLIVGGNTMQRLEGIPYSIVDIIKGLVIVFVISQFVFEKWGDKIVKRNT